MNHINHAVLGDLFSAIRDGKTFYEHAAIKVDKPEFKTLFMRIATVKGEILKDLPSEILPTGDSKPAVTGSVVAGFGKLYAEVGHLLKEKSLEWVARLADSEGRLVTLSEGIITDANTPAPVRSALTRHLPDIRSCHQLMLKFAPVKKAA